MHDAITVGSRLSELETVIERGLQTFVDVGMALAEIQRDKLYRDGHSTFEDYCRDKWRISRPRAYQLIESAEAVTQMSTMVDKEAPLVENERQARELSKIKDPEIRTQVWQMANDAAEAAKTAVTAKLVKQAVTTLESHEEFQRRQPLQIVPDSPPQQSMPSAPSDEGLWLHGVLCEIENNSDVHINEIIAGMTPMMREEMRVLIPQTVNWLNSYE